MPRAYLSKVLQGLARGGVVQSQRGLGGGITLAISPADLTILKVVNAVDLIGRDSKLLPSFFGCCRVPALKISAWDFTGTTEF